jgi:hypothetical protein
MGLIDVLKRCRALTATSQDSDWCSLTAAEIGTTLDRAIALLETRGEIDRAELLLLFAPTGSLQETSMANGWAREYLALSSAFDDLIERQGVRQRNDVEKADRPETDA